MQVAIESCLQSHQWGTAMRLAETYTYPEAQSFLAQYANQLLASGKHLHAVDLYRKANRYSDSAKLLSRLGARVGRHARTVDHHAMPGVCLKFPLGWSYPDAPFAGEETFRDGSS